MFSRKVLPDVDGMEANRGKEKPRMPELPVPDRWNPEVSFAAAMRES
jgi:hypothetical protein